MRRFSLPAPNRVAPSTVSGKTYYDIAFGVMCAGTASPVDEAFGERPYARRQFRGHFVSFDLGLLTEGKLGILPICKLIAGK